MLETLFCSFISQKTVKFHYLEFLCRKKETFMAVDLLPKSLFVRNFGTGRVLSITSYARCLCSFFKYVWKAETHDSYTMVFNNYIGVQQPLGKNV